MYLRPGDYILATVPPSYIGSFSGLKPGMLPSHDQKI